MMTDKPHSRPLEAVVRKRWFLVVSFFVGWGVAGTLSTIHWRMFRFYDPYTFSELWRIKLVLWYIWGGVTFFILYLSRRYRITRQDWIRHSLCLMIWSLIVTAAYMAIYDIAVIINRGNPLSWMRFRGMFRFVLDYHSSFFFLAFWATVGIEHAYDYFNKFRERELRTTRLETQLAQTRLESLKSRLNPHFLFNALNAVSSLVYHKRNDEAYDLIARIAELLRQSVKDHDRHEVPLCDELKFVDLYLEIVRIRFRDRLKVKRTIADNISRAAVPSLILQPLVENAVKHGLASNSRDVTVHIEASRLNDSLSVTVRDDGPGLPQDWTLDESTGFGLSSARERLQNLYGSSQQFEVVNAGEAGVEVRITIPYQELRTEETVS